VLFFCHLLHSVISCISPLALSLYWTGPPVLLLLRWELMLPARPGCCSSSIATFGVNHGENDALEAFCSPALQDLILLEYTGTSSVTSGIAVLLYRLKMALNQ